MKSSNASTSAFGWDFQCNAAIAIMLKNIAKATCVKVEGENEDIEVTLSDGKIIFSQAKSVSNPHNDFTHVTKNLKDALRTLNKAAKTTKIDKLIYITNSPNPFNNKHTMAAFSGSLISRPYSELPDVCQDKLEKFCQAEAYDFNRDQFFIYVMQFYGNDDEIRYLAVKDLINEFLSSLDLRYTGLAPKLLEIWQRWFFINATQKIVNITKKEMIWPLIVHVCGINNEDEMLANCDEGECEEVMLKYESLINNNSERFEFVTKVMSAYNLFEPAMKSKERTQKFISNQWTEFQSEFDAPNLSSNVLEIIVKFAVASVIKRRSVIARINKEVNL